MSLMLPAPRGRSGSSAGGSLSASVGASIPTPQGRRSLRPADDFAEKGSADEECARLLQLEFDREAADKAARASFTCPLCFDTTSFENGVQLDCQHRLCTHCFRGYLEVKIREKVVGPEELTCPMPDCGCEVTVMQVEGAVRKDPLWERFLAARAELWQPDGSQNERICQCPMPNCGARFLTRGERRLFSVRCAECSAVFCGDCGLQHPGSSCEQFREWQRQNDSAEAEFDRLMKRERWVRCPHCNVPCERKFGCNFMTCHSASCRGKAHFCYICAKPLTEEEHYSHFPYGLFADGCEEVDRRSEAPKRRQRPDVDATWLLPLLESFRHFARRARELA